MCLDENCLLPSLKLGIYSLKEAQSIIVIARILFVNFVCLYYLVGSFFFNS